MCRDIWWSRAESSLRPSMHTEMFTMSAKWLSGVLMTGVVALCAAPAWSQEDLRVRQLENEVSRLQRELDAQSRRIDDLERNTRSGVLCPRLRPPTQFGGALRARRHGSSPATGTAFAPA